MNSQCAVFCLDIECNGSSGKAPPLLTPQVHEDFAKGFTYKTTFLSLSDKTIQHTFIHCYPLHLFSLPSTSTAGSVFNFYKYFQPYVHSFTTVHHASFNNHDCSCSYSSLCVRTRSAEVSHAA
jgi:hypothetical protein